MGSGFFRGHFLEDRDFMREEFASRSFLAVAMVGAALLCLGLLALAFA